MISSEADETMLAHISKVGTFDDALWCMASSM